MALAPISHEAAATHGARSTNELVTRYLPLARKLAWRYAGHGEPLDDLIQVASVGLVNAARRFDETRGIGFGAYAIPMITGELKRHFRDHCWSVYVPRAAKDRAMEISRAAKRLGEDGADLTEAELAQRLELDQREVREAVEAWTARRTSSIDAPSGSQPAAGTDPLSEMMGAPDSGYELVEARSARRTAMRTLTTLERKILYLRYVEDRNQRDIATRVGISQTHVSRTLRRVLERLEIVAPAGHERPVSEIGRVLSAPLPTTIAA